MIEVLLELGFSKEHAEQLRADLQLAKEFGNGGSPMKLSEVSEAVLQELNRQIPIAEEVRKHRNS